MIGTRKCSLSSSFARGNEGAGFRTIEIKRSGKGGGPMLMTVKRGAIGSYSQLRDISVVNDNSSGIINGAIDLVNVLKEKIWLLPLFRSSMVKIRENLA